MIPAKETEFTESANMGKVFLVGAGPGDPRYITLRGIECLKSADAILYDYLTNVRILEHAPLAAERICLGRHGRENRWTQDRINEELVNRAKRGQNVVRLKSGDPAIFGRLADELGHLRQHSISFEIVPGISAALAAGSCVGIPLTHREMASAVAFVTGQENPNKAKSSIDYGALAKFPGTIVMYMGVTTVQHWTTSLIEAGMSSKTPVALIRRCSFHDQQVVRTDLGGAIACLTPRSKLPPPVIAVIGQVAHIDQQLDWFANRPLLGQSVLVTRAKEQCGQLADKFICLGAAVHTQPAIQVGPVADWTHLDETIEQLANANWLIFASANGVRFFLDRLLEIGHDVRWLSNVKIAVMGSQTARQLTEYSLVADLVPQEYRAEMLGSELAPLAKDSHFVIVRASRGRDVLAPQLQAAGGVVRQVVAYQSTDVKEADPDVLASLDSSKITWTTVTSSAIARSLVNLFGESLKNTRLASISPITSATLRELGFEPAVEAEVHTMDGLIDAMCRAC